MREINAIISSYEIVKNNNTPCVLATVVHVEGSSYRRAGARMLVDENGVMTGAISGGCLEGDALRKALHALHKKQSKLVTYDTSDENDAVIGAQLGCNGVIQVLFEPIDFLSKKNPIELLKSASESKQPMVIGTFFHLDKTQEQIGTTFLVDNEFKRRNLSIQEEFIDQVIVDSKVAFSSKCSLFRKYKIDKKEQYLFLELFNSPPNLILVGAGNDAQILSQMAEALGWSIVVTDGRPTHASSDRFASSCQVKVVKPEEVLDNIEITDQTAFVLMTHNFKYDLSVLKVLLSTSNLAPYIGILGPKKKYQLMLDDIAKEGIELSEKQLSVIHAPVGLEIGAETPAEIGLSILSEIQAVLTHTKGGKLKDKDGPIHQKKNNEFKEVVIE